MQKNFSNQLTHRRADLVTNFLHGIRVLLYDLFKQPEDPRSGDSDDEDAGTRARLPAFDIGSLQASELAAFLAALPKMQLKDADPKRRRFAESCLLEVPYDAEENLGEVSLVFV
jgi:hypothetical protein